MSKFSLLAKQPSDTEERPSLEEIPSIQQREDWTFPSLCKIVTFAERTTWKREQTVLAHEKGEAEELTRTFLSLEKAECCHTVTAVSGGHMGLRHLER